MLNKIGKEKEPCCPTADSSCACDTESNLLPMFHDTADDDVCCGPPPAPKSSPLERPGYSLCQYVARFTDTPVGPVPIVKTSLERRDILGTIAVRLGVNRTNYTVSPGLYGVGNPNPDSPVLVTANYKLSFDTLRREISAVDAWILVVDTRGINVWCAAGKKLFSTEEVARQVEKTGLSRIVRHRTLILPQLSATGVSAREVKKECGFKVAWGPVRAEDIRAFLESGMEGDASMRRVTFPMKERLVLIPVELAFLPKPTLWILIGIFLISGIGLDIFSFSASWFRGLMLLAAYISGILAGAVVAPTLLPWIPGRAFSLKGTITGLIVGLVFIALLRGNFQGWEWIAILLSIVSVSSYLAMNFTGSTPFTSPSGVEKEMRKAIPVQAGSVLIAAVLWVGSAFFV